MGLNLIMFRRNAQRWDVCDWFDSDKYHGDGDFVRCLEIGSLDSHSSYEDFYFRPSGPKDYAAARRFVWESIEGKGNQRRLFVALGRMEADPELFLYCSV